MALTKATNSMIVGAPISALDYGADPTGAVDCTTELQASIDAIPAGGDWVLPPGTYKTSAKLSFADMTDCTLQFLGDIVNDTTDCLEFDNLNRCTVTGVNVGRSTISGGAWSGIGVNFINALNRSNIQIDRVFGFEKGMQLFSTDDNPAATGHSWNYFKLGEFRDNKYGVYFTTTTNGFINQNTFDCGLVLLSSAIKSWDTANGDVTWGMYFDPVVTWIYSNNTFRNTDISNIGNGVHTEGIYNFLFDGVRFETVANYWIEAQTGDSLTIRPATDFDGSKVLLGTNMRGVNIIGAAKYATSTFRSQLMDVTYGGLQFFHPSNITNTLSGFYADYVNFHGLRATNYLNASQNLDKQFTGSAAPTSGTYNKNAVVWNTNVASGQTMGWVASRAGTMGTLVGVTADTTNGSPTVTVNDASNLTIGQEISIAGAATGVVITNIVGTTITISSNASATVLGAAVSYYAATWVAMPTYP